jgi:hypothetical protein
MVVDDERGHSHAKIVAHRTRLFLMDIPDLPAISGISRTRTARGAPTVGRHQALDARRHPMFVAKALVVAGAVGIALAHPTAAHDPQTLHLTAVSTQGEPFPAHTRRGDQQIASGSLLDARQQPAGTFGFTCQAVGLHPRFFVEQCLGWGRLAGGTITVAGMARDNENRHVWAVTGGTGAYRGARGEARLHDLDRRRTVIDATLTVAAT